MLGKLLSTTSALEKNKMKVVEIFLKVCCREVGEGPTVFTCVFEINIK